MSFYGAAGGIVKTVDPAVTQKIASVVITVSGALPPVVDIRGVITRVAPPKTVRTPRQIAPDIISVDLFIWAQIDRWWSRRAPATRLSS